MTEPIINKPPEDWRKTACVLCSSNCGIEVKLDERAITRVRGNKAHVTSAGYTCEKALRIDHYQNNHSRLTSPMRRLDDGTYVEVDWDTAIAGVAEGLRSVTERYGDDRILYYGGGGQGNHLGGAHSTATQRAFGMKRRSNALAQEKTGEAYVEGLMFGTHTHGQIEEAQVAVFVGKNPWHSHGFDAARRVLKEIAADPDRQLIVIDPRRTETADLADYWLPVRPGTDAFLLAAIGAVLVDERLTSEKWLTDHVVGVEAATTALGKVPIVDFAKRCGITESQIREVARLLASATSVSMLEDLGIEMAPHSTLVSYLHRLVSVLTGNIGNPGGLTPHTSIAGLFNYSAAGNEPVDPVTGGRIISGLVSCNEIAEGILSDHPERTRAMFIESANPVHSLADSDTFRRAMRACECTVVIDVAMTETAEQANWVLPAASQYEKAEATFFASGFPDNHFHMRPGILEPLEGTLAEPEIHARLVRASGTLDAAEEAGVLDDLRAAAAGGIDAFTTTFTTAVQHHQELSSVGAVVLYETLGRTLPAGSEGAAATWFLAQMTAMQHPEAVRAAGHEGDGPALGNALWQAIIDGEDGVVFTRHDYSEALDLLGTPDGHINLDLPEMLALLGALPEAPERYTSNDYPYVLSAGERRSFTANTIIRDPSWRKKDAQGALRLSSADAEALGVDDGGRVRITTPGGVAVAVAEINNTMQEGHVSLPNGHGLAYSPAGGDPEIYGVAPNELTTLDWCDPIVGTPWHKHVPARLEAVSP